PERSYHGPPPAERLRPLLDETTSPAPLAALPPFRPPPFEPIDADLDPDQRDAVARALASPDLYLIRGLPGSGKTRAVVELIRQAVRRGERVLFLAGTPQAIDAALRPLAGDAEVRLLRCLGRGERAESLPEPGRSCTWAAVRERLPAPAAAGAGAGELPAKLAALEARAGELDRELRRFAGERARSPAAPTPAAREARRAELRKRRADAAEALRRVGQEVAECERLQDSLRLRRWWTVAYWRAPRADDLAEKLSRLAGRRDTLEEELRALEQELAELEKGAGPEATAEEARLAAERGALAAEAEAVRARLRSLGTSGADPAAPGESPELYRDRANLFAGPVSAPVTDPVFAGASDGRPFDLLVLDDAESVSEAAFLPAARLARRWVLVGAESLGRPRGRPAAGRTRPGDCFDHLWRQLYGPAWVWEQGRLCCRLVRLTQRQRRHLAAEPVADRPEIELRIYAAPGGEPLLAEVVFPPGMPAREAKAYLFRELGVVTPQAARPVPRLEKRADGWFLSLTGREESGGGERVELAPGVREVLLDRPCPETGFAGTPWAAPVYTAGIEFAAGWDREQVEAWAREHTADIERRRATRLWNSHRQVPALAAWVRDLFGAEADGLATGAAAPVEFVPVPDAALPPGAPAPAAEGNGRPHPDSPFPSGAGLEIDLGNPGDRNRLPPDLAALLPRSGFVNLAEAERLVQILG
ncbi:MAG TPA: AAA domain-containing protein, partial [Gemmataceae bacterium]